MTSLVMCGGGLGSIIQAIISAIIINPDNMMPTIESDAGAVHYSYYDTEVTDNVPLLFRIFGVVEIFVLIFSLYFVWIPPYLLDDLDEIKMPWNVEPNQ